MHAGPGAARAVFFFWTFLLRWGFPSGLVRWGQWACRPGSAALLNWDGSGSTFFFFLFFSVFFYNFWFWTPILTKYKFCKYVICQYRLLGTVFSQNLIKNTLNLYIALYRVLKNLNLVLGLFFNSNARWKMLGFKIVSWDCMENHDTPKFGYLLLKFDTHIVGWCFTQKNIFGTRKMKKKIMWRK